MRNRYAAYELSTADLTKIAEQALVNEGPSYMADERYYTTHAPLLTLALNGDDMLAESNYSTILAHLQAYADRIGSEDALIVARIQHWAVGRLEQVFVKVRTEAGVFAPVFREAAAILRSLVDFYPVFDEEDYIARGWVATEEALRQALADLDAPYQHWVDSEEDVEAIKAAVGEAVLADGELLAADVDQLATQAEAAYEELREQFYLDRARAQVQAQIDGQGALALV